MASDSILPKGLEFNTTTGMIYGIPEDPNEDQMLYNYSLKINGYNSLYFNQIILNMEIIRKPFMFINRTTVRKRYFI